MSFMIRKTFHISALFVMVFSAGALPTLTQSLPSNAIVVYEGARLIPGDGSPPIQSSAMLVQSGTITGIGPKGNVPVPRGATRMDLTGKTIMPTLINTHGHPGFQRGLTYTAANFTRETIVDDMNRALYFGIAVVQSQGIEKGDVTYQVRADQEAGELKWRAITDRGTWHRCAECGPRRSSLCRHRVRSNNRRPDKKGRSGVGRPKGEYHQDLGRRSKRPRPRLAPDLYRAAIDEGHKHGLKVNAHVFYHTDAVDLVNAGIDGFAHLVRDKEMDDELIASIVRHNVYVMPNLSPEWSTMTTAPIG